MADEKEYGLTPEGVNIKRLDDILTEMHEDLTEAWGVNTQQNPNSLLNVMLTNIADHLAELWELGEDVYNSQYPSTAEGMYLDQVSQFAGVSRETAAPSYYHILCTGVDGTTIPEDTLICSDTSPVTNLLPTKENTISRDEFNTASIKVVALDGNPITVALDGAIYSVTPEAGSDIREALESLAEKIVDDNFTASVSDPPEEGSGQEDDPRLNIAASSVITNHILTLSNNLTTETVGSVFTFATEEDGDIYIPAGGITTITKAVTGLLYVENVGSYIAGQQNETDTAYRQSYLDKIFTRSANMVVSIRSAILNNVQGVTAIAVYENDTDYTDEYGRYPHSIEVIVDGGDETEIAQQILDTKPGGIATYGSIEIPISGEYEDEITIRFNRPSYLRLWIQVNVYEAKGATLPSNYVDLIREVVVNKVAELQVGDDVIPQDIFLPEIYASVYGISYVIVKMGVGEEAPSEYSEYNLYATERERYVTQESMIEVVLGG